MTTVLIKELEKKVDCLTTDNQVLSTDNQVLSTDNQALETQNNTYRIESENYQKRCEHLEEEYENLLAIIKNANRKLYGTQSERYIEDSKNPQLTLFDDIPPGASSEEIKAEMKDVSYQRKKKNRKTDYSK
jgi:FtsZ-binding cell division protein ZapB